MDIYKNIELTNFNHDAEKEELGPASPKQSRTWTYDDIEVVVRLVLAARSVEWFASN